MTEKVNPVIESPRVERLLDAAAALLVRWGYRRVTIEDVAREAGVGKGTVYLHFRTKEALFLTVLLREQRAVLGGLTARMRADPREVLPGRLTRTAYELLSRSPIARALYLGNPETFGQLAHEAAGTLGEFSARRDEALIEHLRLLREAGLLRSDHDLASQRYLFAAIGLGFFLLDPATVAYAPADPDVRAELLEHAISTVLEVPGAVPSQAVAEAVAARYDPLIEDLDAEWRARVTVRDPKGSRS